MAEPEMWDELLVGLRAQRAGTWGPGQAGGKWPQGRCQPALSDLASIPSKVRLAQALPTLAASRNLFFVPELILRNLETIKLCSGPLPSPPFLPHSTLFSLLGLVLNLAGMPCLVADTGRRQWASPGAVGGAGMTGATSAARWGGCWRRPGNGRAEGRNAVRLA